MPTQTFPLFFKANLLLTALLFSLFLSFNQGYTLLTFGVTLAGAIGSAGVLYLLFALLLLPLRWSPRWRLPLSALLFILTDVALLSDLFIYKLFGFHINAMVLNILTSPDALDSIQAGVMPLILFGGLVVGSVALEWYLLHRLHRLSLPTQQRLNRLSNRVILLPLLVIILGEKVSYGVASLFSYNAIVSKFRVIPLYQPLTFRRIAAKHFGFKAEEQAKYSIQTDATLHYPLRPLTLAPRHKPFPIFIIASDAVKYTILSPELTPHLTAFAKESLNFKHHYSGGNSTRFGIFSLMYGLNATYWFSFLNANQKPLLFDILQQLHYQIDIFSSTNTNWPEFRKTCYVAIQSSIQDKFAGVPWRKDRQNTDCFLQSLTPTTTPRFSFVFLDAPHGYSYPQAFNLHHAPKEEINYLKVTQGSQELQKVIKRYKNAVAYNDALFGEMIAKLKAVGLYEESLILFTSDHGQEFFEQGNFGHNTAFSEGQIHIPLLMKLPKSLQNQGLGRAINDSLSSHQDLVPTLLTLLGVTSDPQSYSNGKDLLAPTFHRDYVLSANWNNNAIITPTRTYLFSNLPNKMFSSEIRDSQSYQLLSKERVPSQLILHAIDENKKFIRP